MKSICAICPKCNHYQANRVYDDEIFKFKCNMCQHKANLKEVTYTTHNNMIAAINKAIDTESRKLFK